MKADQDGKWPSLANPLSYLFHQIQAEGTFVKEHITAALLPETVHIGAYRL